MTVMEMLASYRVNDAGCGDKSIWVPVRNAVGVGGSAEPAPAGSAVFAGGRRQPLLRRPKPRERRGRTVQNEWAGAVTRTALHSPLSGPFVWLPFLHGCISCLVAFGSSCISCLLAFLVWLSSCIGCIGCIALSWLPAKGPAEGPGLDLSRPLRAFSFLAAA